MTDAELGWVAGILDGEGCIYAPPKGYLVIMVTNCDPRIIRRLVALVGGNFYPPTKTPLRKSTHNPLYQWHLHGSAAVDLLRSVRPLLVGKGDQADLALEWEVYDGQSGRAMPPAMRANRERIRVGLKALKLADHKTT